MNNTILTGVLSLLIGIGVGWLLKPSSPEKDPNSGGGITNQESGLNGSSGALSASTQRRGAASLPSAAPTKSERRPKSEGSASPGSIDQVARELDHAEAIKRAQEEALAQLRGSQRIQMEELSESLGLTPDQKEKLQTQYFNTVQQLNESIRNGDPGDIPTAPDLGKVLGALLTDEQAQIYEDLQTRQVAHQLEARTLRRMADLSFLDLSAEQRDSVYDILYTQAETRQAAVSAPHTSSAERIVTFNTAVSGGAADAPVAGTIITSVNAIGRGDGSIVSFSTTQESEEARAQRIEKDTARFQDVFSPTQMDQYRRHLTNRSAGLSSQPRLPPLVR